MVLLAGKIHKFNVKIYIRNFIFLIPFIHAFGRIGCFFAGCCFGIPYNGIGAVVFPENSYALPDVSLFPVQLVEQCFFTASKYCNNIRIVGTEIFIIKHTVFGKFLVKGA